MLITGTTSAIVAVCQSIGVTGAIAAATSVIIGTTTAAVGLAANEAIGEVKRLFKSTDIVNSTSAAVDSATKTVGHVANEAVGEIINFINNW